MVVNIKNNVLFWNGKEEAFPNILYTWVCIGCNMQNTLFANNKILTKQGVYTVLAV